MIGVKKRIVRRDPVAGSASGFPTDLITRILRARGVNDPSELDHGLSDLLSPLGLKDIELAAGLVATAITEQNNILIVGDFDADGATSCALMVSVLQAFGTEHVNFLVPDRFKFGYGLTPEIVDVAKTFSPDLLITVDNGISSVDGVAQANALGTQVIVTDHHLPGSVVPSAAAIVNPNQLGCGFESKNLAGVGVAFYLLSVVRSELQSRGWFNDKPAPSLAQWLDLVALGTVADVVKLDQNNRRLVEQGLRRIRAGKCLPGIRGIIEAAGLSLKQMTTRDLAFSIAPRLNAAGRLQDMSIGVACLLATGDRAGELAVQLDELNQERKEIEADMRDEALSYVEDLSLEGTKTGGICLYRADWHEGVIGILASRVKEKSQRPVIAFAKTEQGELKGSGRSIQGFHIRDALDAIATKHPGLLLRFGGHAMAAGLSLKEQDLARFSEAFDQQVIDTIGASVAEQVVLTDGEVDQPITVQLARELEQTAPWGQGIAEPEFDDWFEVLEQHIVGGRHLKLLLQPALGEPVDAISFNQGGLLESRKVHCAYRIEVNRFRGRETPQLIISVVMP